MEGCNVAELKSILKFLKLKSSGTKAELRQRLESYFNDNQTTYDYVVVAMMNAIEEDPADPVLSPEHGVGSASSLQELSDPKGSEEPPSSDITLNKEHVEAVVTVVSPHLKVTDPGGHHMRNDASREPLIKVHRTKSVASSSSSRSSLRSSASTSERRRIAAVNYAKMKASRDKRREIMEREQERRRLELKVAETEIEAEEEAWRALEREEDPLNEEGADDRVNIWVANADTGDVFNMLQTENSNVQKEVTDQPRPQKERVLNINDAVNEIPPSPHQHVSEAHVLKELIKFNDRAMLPKREIEVFKGQIERFVLFKTAFESAVGSFNLTDREKLHYLYQYTEATPRELVESCLYMNDREGYRQAWKLLQKRYGSSERIGAAHIQRVLNFQDIPRDDPGALDQFSIVLMMTSNAVSQIPYSTNELENPNTIRQIISKLPYTMQERWSRIATEMHSSTSKPAGFKELLKFVESEASVANNPFYGKAVMKRISPSIKTVHQRKVLVGTLQEREECVNCGGAHYLRKCTSFHKYPHDKKVRILRSNECCFGCLERGHIISECKTEERCGKCGGKHNILLHIENPTYRRWDKKDNSFGMNQNKHIWNGEEEMEGTKTNLMRSFTKSKDTGETSTHELDNFKSFYFDRRTSLGGPVRAGNKLSHAYGSQTGRMCILPVTVICSQGNLVETFALIDSGSAVTLCSRALLRRLEVSSYNVPTTNLTVVTLGGECVMDGRFVDGLSLRGDSGDDIPLPPVYAVKNIPVDKEDAADGEQIRKWNHLKEITTREIGNVESYNNYHVRVGKISVRDVTLNDLVSKAFNSGFHDIGAVNKGPSVEDEIWLQIVKDSCKKVNGKFEIALPLRKDRTSLPYSRGYALMRLWSLRKKLIKDEQLCQKYSAAMSEMLDKGYAEEVPPKDLSVVGSWYVPHFSVSNPQKPDKTRIVFDCAAKVNGTCLNDILLTGPPIGNEMFDILQRFREGKHAYTADVEAMFYQVKVPVRDRSYLRFFWWRNFNSECTLTEYRMTVHLFGACSSPSIAAYALRQIVAEQGYSREAKDTIVDNFYVDDCMKAGHNEVILRKNASEVMELCGTAGFKLSKHKGTFRFDDLGMSITDNSTFRALGVVWNLGEDELKPTIPNIGVPNSRRQLLSVIASIYDPLGIIAPIVLKGRLLLQESFRKEKQLGWDEPLPRHSLVKIDSWVEELQMVHDVSVPRNLMEDDEEQCNHQLHLFSDASLSGHGSVAYLRTESGFGVRCRFVWGKAKVNPMRDVSIPRLELVAAVLSSHMRVKLEECLRMRLDEVFLWTDSLTVIKYLRNEKDRFNVFIANRVTLIKERSKIDEWRYVDTKSNPADDASRAVLTKRWNSAPEFLLEHESKWPRENLEIETVQEAALEIRTTMNVLSAGDKATDYLLSYFSDWTKLKIAVAWLLEYKRVKMYRISRVPSLSRNHLKEAEHELIKYTQRKSYAREVELLNKGLGLGKKSPLWRLDVFLEDELMRVGGRLRRSSLEFDVKHPIVIPCDSFITTLIVRESHERLGHLGLRTVLADTRERYWITKGHSTVKRVLRTCVKCRKVQGPVLEQKMADLPPERISSGAAPFTHTGVYCFGPFTVKIGRRSEKRYGVLFTCLAMRAIHLEVAQDLSTDSMCNVLRRFLARRGTVQKFVSDNGTNFIGARKEILQALTSDSIRTKVNKQEIDWILNPPNASHFGGAWERLIRVVRRVLESLLSKQSLTDDSLRTLFCEAELAVNSRPLSIVTTDTTDLDVITPNRLLTLGSCPLPWGNTDSSGSCSQKRWKQVQFLADQFWRKWCKEYRTTLQERRKWTKTKRNVKENDVVLIVNENEARCHWPLGRVARTIRGADGLVRSVDISTNGKTYRRPISKLIMVMENEDML